MTGDSASAAVPSGAYAYIKNNTHSLADGYYQNTSASAFPVSGGTADSTVFTAVPAEGVLNALNNKIVNVSSTAAGTVAVQAVSKIGKAVFGCIDVNLTSAVGQDTWATNIAQISDAANYPAVQTEVPADSGGGYGGIVRINTNGQIDFYNSGSASGSLKTILSYFTA